MKYLKMLGLAAMAAMALMAFLGASSASATVLCTTTSTPCGAEWHVKQGTVLKASLKAGTKAVLKDTSGFLQDECGESAVEGPTANTGGKTETVTGSVETKKLTWGACSAEVTNTLKGGQLEVHWISGSDNGTVTAKEFEVTVKTAGTSCIFKAGAGIDLGTLTGSGTEPTLTINTVVEGSGGFLCPSTGRWTGTYVLTSPTSVFVEES